jgi:hypothetical protein
MLSAMLLVASVCAGAVKAPWWFWVLSGVTIAIVSATEPGRLRIRTADVRGLAALPLVFEDLKLAARGCALSGAAFAAGSTASGFVLG